MRKLLLAAFAFGSMTAAANAADTSSLPLLNGVSNAVLTSTEMAGVQGEGSLVTIQISTQTNVCAGINVQCQQANQNIQQIGAVNVAVNELLQNQDLDVDITKPAPTPTPPKPSKPEKPDHNKGKKWEHKSWMKMSAKYHK